MDQRPAVNREFRRRRLLREAPAAAESEEKPAKNRPTRLRVASSSRRQAYHEQTLTQGQPRVTDLIPRRPYRLLLVFLICGFPLAAVESLYVVHIQGLPGIPAAPLDSFSLYGPGTVANWLSTTSLALAALLALVVYSVRRHRLDDYAGHYRLWLVVAMGFGLASLHVSTGVGQVLQAGLESLVGTAWANYPGPWGRWGGWALMGLLAARVALDVLRSPGSLLMLIVSLSCFGVSGFSAWVLPGDSLTVLHPMWQGGWTLASHLGACLTLLVYARYICREAAGEAVDRRRPKARREATAAAAIPQSRWRGWWPGRSPAAASKGQRRAPAAETLEAAAGASAAEDSSPAPLTLLGASAERRLKKQQRRQQRQAA